MKLYQYYKVTEEDIFDKIYSELDGRLDNYVPLQIGGFEELRTLVESPSFPENALDLIYSDLKVVSLRQEGKKKYQWFGKRGPTIPAVYGLEFVMKAGSEERLKKFEVEELGVYNDKVLFSLSNLRNFGIEILENKQVYQAAFGFVAKDVEHLMYEFETGDDVDYLADCRMSLSVDLPENDGEEGMVLGNIEPVLELREYMLDKFLLGINSIAFK